MTTAAAKEANACWKRLPLKRVATINPDALPEDTDPDFEIEYVDIGGVSLASGISKIDKQRFGDAPSRARRRVKMGDTIVSTVRTYLRAIAPVIDPPDNLIVSTGFAVIRSSGSVEPSFLSWVLRSTHFVEAVVAQSVGVSYPAISPVALGEIVIEFPALQLQRSIAEFLDRETAKIDALIAKQTEFLTRLEEHHRAFVSEILSGAIEAPSALHQRGRIAEKRDRVVWKDTSVRYVTTQVTSGPRGWSDLRDDAGSLFFQSQNIGRAMEQVFDSTVRVALPSGSDARRAGLAEDDVVVCITGARTGAIAHIDKLREPAYVNQHVCLLRSDKTKLNGRYLCYYLWSDLGRAQFDIASYGLKQGLSLDDIRSIRLPLPSLEVQGARIASLDVSSRRFSKVQSLALAVINDLKERRTAVITAAVTGQMDGKSDRRFECVA